MPDPSSVNDDDAALFAYKVWSYKQGEAVAMLVHLGDRLGLYRALRDAGPVTPSALAASTGLHERWLREWLRGNGAAGLLEWHPDDTFELTTTGAAVLADEDDSIWFAAGAFGAPPAPDFVDDLVDAFRTGIGLPYDRQGPAGAHQTERSLGPWSRLALVPRILPALDGVVGKLEAGGRLADLGCGAGVALTAIATAFPRAELHGFDISRHAIDRAEQRLAAEGVDNVALHLAGPEAFPTEPAYDVVMTLDCLHDMTHPQDAMAAIRRAIRPDGTWLVKDIRCAPVARDNLKNPMAAMMYSASITSCMSSALSEPGGAGLGTLGLDPERLERMAREAGFGSFRTWDFGDPANLYYEIRA